ncbi:Rad52/Rad22 family DNA repair protein [Gracilibacillus sp. YIM 98692]|uniref:Rad52/Rad22 family DNA repair protein n=1 Tax=Gracilibacillus sp. YIM 98692 TaxID=2663532 RepID=UPI0013D291EC|nr:Rad52/Rad22 family DNA repair protein [Gracilibacillus sp. YIM 98692]
MSKSWGEIMEALQKPFRDEEMEWRPQHAIQRNQGYKLLVLPYVQGHAIQTRLDEVLGPNWSDDYESIQVNGKEAFRGKLSIKVDGEWVTRTDAAEVSNIESVKGGHTNAFKRVAVKFGIGRYLYNVDPVWVPLLDKGDIRVNGCFKINGKECYLQGGFQRPSLQGTKAMIPSHSHKQQQTNQPNGHPDPSPNQTSYTEQDVTTDQWKWIRKTETLLELKDDYIIRIFNKANQSAFQSVQQIRQEANAKQLRAYCLVLQPVRTLALLPKKFTNCSLEEVLTFAQTYKPEVHVTDIYSLFFQLSKEDLEQIIDLTKRAHIQRQTA